MTWKSKNRRPEPRIFPGHIAKAVLGVCFLLLLFSLSCSEPAAEELEAEIAKYPLLGVANELCTDTPVPEGFVLVRKSIGSNSNYSLISFDYHGDLKADKVLEFFNDHFVRNGWERNSFDAGEYGAGFIFMRFNKDNAFVSIENRNPDYVNYSVSCGVFAK